MRRILFAVILTLLLAAPLLAEDRATVFRDLAWGDPMEALGRVRATEDRGRFKEYARRDEDFALGPVEAVMIRYGFFDDQLFKITVGARNDQPLDEVVRTRYGEPDLDLVAMVIWTLPDEDTIVTYGSQQGYKVMILTAMSIDETYRAWKKEQELLEAQSAW